ncbi:MAG: baseplate J/gp47 family protein [Chloroflexota bacterium]
MRATAPAPASLSQEVIFLDPDDDLGTVRSKLESTSADEIYVVIPRWSSILRSPLEFRILARLAHDLSSETIIVTSDANRRGLAKQEGLRTKRSVRSIRHLSRPPGTWSFGVPALPEWLPLPSVAGLVIFGSLVAFFGAALLVALPVMSVTVSPETVAQKRDFELFVDPNFKQPDVAKATIPGEVLQQKVEVVGSFQTSGGRRVGRDRAKGELVFTNGGAQPVTVPRGTVVSSRNGVRFQTDADVQVGPQGLSRMSATAIDPGPNGNIAVAQIARIDAMGGQPPSPPPSTLGVRNERAFAGGTERDGRVVTSDDVNKLREQLTEKARRQAMDELFARATGERSLVQMSVRLKTEESYDPPVDSEADQVNGKLSAVATAVVFVNADFDGMVKRLFINGFAPGFDIPQGQLRVGTPQVQSVDELRVRVKTTSDATLVRQLNPGAIAEQLRWKTLSGATDAAGKIEGLAVPPRIEMWPTWALWAYRVDVTVR